MRRSFLSHGCISRASLSPALAAFRRPSSACSFASLIELNLARADAQSLARPAAHQSTTQQLEQSLRVAGTDGNHLLLIRGVVRSSLPARQDEHQRLLFALSLSLSSARAASASAGRITLHSSASLAELRWADAMAILALTRARRVCERDNIAAEEVTMRCIAWRRSPHSLSHGLTRWKG